MTIEIKMKNEQYLDKSTVNNSSSHRTLKGSFFLYKDTTCICTCTNH